MVRFPFQVVFTPGQQDKCFLCGQMGHFASDCEGKAKRKAGEFDEKGDSAVVAKKPFQVGFHSLCSKYCIFFGSYLYIPIFTFLAVSPHLDSSRVFGAWDDNSQLSVQDWFWMHCGWFYFHVFLCWQWFLTPHAHFGDSWGLLKNQFLLE